MISLSVYGDANNPLYAAVWVQRSGSAWVAVHGVDGNGYQSFFNTWTAQGYVPTLISATGTIDNAIFAGVFEQGIAGPWSTQFGMSDGSASTPGTFQYNNAQALSGSMILQSMAVYGTAGQRLYSAVWHANPGFVKWHPHTGDTGSSYQVTFNTETQLPGYQLAAYRPAYVALSGDVIYCSVFKDDVVGPWVARHGMTGSDYQNEFDQQVANGFYPICTQGGGTTSEPIYAAIFAQQDIPLSREWTVTGAEVPALAQIDQLMQTFMQTNAVRAAQAAITKDGELKFSRGYTWAEAGYRITQPSDRFLLASCSKIFLEAAVQSLYNANLLTPTTTVYPLLGFSNPVDPRSDTITIEELLTHSGGYDDTSTGSGFDPTYNMRTIGLAIGHVVANKLDVAGYMYGKMLDYTPFPLPPYSGAYKYSNYGYLLAGAVVEKVSGMPYADYVQQAVLQPNGIGEVNVFSTLASGRTNNEAIAEDDGLGNDPLNLPSELLIPNVYGGDSEINEIGDANDGMAASAEALAQFVSFYPVWGNGSPATGYFRDGSTPGASTLTESRSDGVNWAYVLNTRNWPPSSPASLLSDLKSSIDTFLNTATF